MPITRGEITVDAERHIFDPNHRTFEEREREIKAIEEHEEELRKREKQSPYVRWTQFNLENTKELMWLGLNHPKSRAILDFLVDQMDGHNAVICSYKVLQELIGISKSTAIRAVNVLKDKKFLTILRSGQSNVYIVNDTLCWKSWGNNLKYSKFSAKIVISLSEQDESYQRLLNAEYDSQKIKTVTAKSKDGEVIEVEINNSEV